MQDDEAGGLGAQAARSEGDGLAPTAGSLLDLLDGEVSFGPDHQERLRLGAEEVIDGTALGADRATAVGHEPQVIVRCHLEELGKGHVGDEARKEGLVRLLHRALDDALQTLGAGMLALGVLGADEVDFIQTYLDHLLERPLEAVDVLRGSDGYGPVPSPVLLPVLLALYREEAVTAVDTGDARLEEGTTAIGDKVLVTYLGAQYAQGVLCFSLGELELIT